jgi:amino acid transporter
MVAIGSSGGVMVWGAECAAFIKYMEWLALNHPAIGEYYDRDRRDLDWQRKRPFLSSLQPFVAWVGLIGCTLIVLVLCSASFWVSDPTPTKIVAAYIGVGTRTSWSKHHIGKNS